MNKTVIELYDKSFNCVMKFFSNCFVFLFFQNYQCLGQPDPNQFMRGLRYVEVDSGYSTSYTGFTKSLDTIQYFKESFDKQNDEKVFHESQRAYIPGNFFRGNFLYGIHYINTDEKDVYVYVYFEGWNSQIENLYSGRAYNTDSIIILNTDIAAALNKMNLMEGTYLVDWSAKQTLPFHQKIIQSVNESNDELVFWVDSVKRVEHHFYLSKRKKQVVSQDLHERTLIRAKSENQTRYLGYYELYQDWGYSYSRNPLYAYDQSVFIINQKVVDEQQVSTETVSPDEIINYIKTGSCVNNEVARKLLSVLEEY